MMSNSKSPRILFTTQLSKKKLAALNSGSFTIETRPFIGFEYVIPAVWRRQIPDKTDAWIFTSKKAVKALKPVVRELKIPPNIFAVGSKTGEKLEKLGLKVTIPNEFNAASLAQKMQGLELKNAVHFCGNLKAVDLNKLLGAETKLTSVEVYRTKLKTHKVNTDQYDGIVFMSPSAIDSFMKENSIESKTVVFCIGPTTEEAAQEAGIENCITPEYSTLDSLVESIHRFYL